VSVRALALLAVACGCGSNPAGSLPQSACDGPPYPIVLHHGFSGFVKAGPLDYFFEVAPYLAAQGVPVYRSAVAPYQSSEVRGVELGAFIDQVLSSTGRCKVDVIAHSQGGLDARYAISSLGYGDKIGALITVSTPHGGTRLADVLLGLVSGPVGDIADVFANLLGQAINPDDQSADLHAALVSLSEANVPAFDAANPDDARVRYFSVAGRSNLNHGDEACSGSLWPNPNAIDAVDPTLLATALFLDAPNDGLVTVQSAKHGEFLGCVPADHLDEVGQIADLFPDPTSGWDHLAFYRQLVIFLRTVGQ
jgi:triacylglycerol lipase